MKMHNPPHPGEVLRELCFDPLGLTVTEAANALGVSRKVLGLVLEDAANVTAIWTLDGIVDLASFLDRQVVIEGLAEFRPSGSLLRIDADAIRTAGAGDSAFSTLPMPEIQRSYQQAAAVVRPGHKPYAAIYGLIPADESDEEFTAAVEAMC